MEPARDVIKSIGENARSKNIYLFRRCIARSRLKRSTRLKRNRSLKRKIGDRCSSITFVTITIIVASITNNFGRVLARNRVASGKREMESGLSRGRLINRRRFVVGIHFGGLDKGWKLKGGVVIRKVGGKRRGFLEIL